MKSTEVRSMIASMLSSRGISLIADTPLNPNVAVGVPSGALPSTCSASVGPCVIDNVQARTSVVTAYYPVVIWFRFPGTVPYHALPVGLVESLAVDFQMRPQVCATDSDWVTEVDEWLIDVYRYEDGRDWIVELSVVIRVTYDWEPEDLAPILSGSSGVATDTEYTIDTLQTSIEGD